MSRRISSLAAQTRPIVDWAVGALGFQLVLRHFYSPLPDIDALPESLWVARSDLLGVDLRVDDALRFLQNDLKPYLAEFDPPRQRAVAGEFYLDNGSYESVDAESLYAILRHAKPGRLFKLVLRSSWG